jgi:FkbM family methyltransferase
MITIGYGIENRYLDVTLLALKQCIKDNILQIPSSEVNRAMLFSDPVPGTLKHICVIIDNDRTIYKHGDEMSIPFDVPLNLDLGQTMGPVEARNKLAQIHASLVLKEGNLYDEYPEQLMSVMFIKPNDKVLEIGSNIGRNTLTISSLLTDQNNLVTLECDPKSYNILLENRALNKYNFRAVNKALSYRPLVLNKWDSKPFTGIVPENHIKVDTITFDDLEESNNIKFDTLVADCEGALYYIFLDNPDILNHINTIIVENDYHDLSHKEKVDNIICCKGFQRVYFQPGGWGPCASRFFEVWKK